jgi:hypothetical protein
MDYTSIKVGQLPTGEISGGNFIPHEVAGVLKKATFTDLAAFIGASDAVGFRAVSVQNGGTLPTTDTQEFILVGPGTYNNVGGGSTITVTEELNALVSNGTYWFVGVQIPIDAPPGNAIWGQIIGTLSNQTDLKNILDLKADLVDGKVPASQLPSYVDDIIEVANYAALPTTGETGKIYLTLDNNKIYRWSGSIYIEIAAENAVWGQIVGTLSNQTDLQSALNLRVPYTGATANVDLGTHTLSSKNLVVNHASGSGVAAQITKGGNGEALTVVKSSGTGNAASITGGTTLISELNLTTDLADAYIASAATWNAKIGGSGTTDYLPKFTGASTIGDSIMSDNGSSIIIGASGTAASKLYVYQNSSSSDGFRVFNANTGGSGGAIKATNYGSGFLFAGNNASSQVFTVENNGDITGNKFTKTGGTSSQFLKADGSIDSNTYCLDSDVVKLTGNQTIAGEKTFSNDLAGTSAIFSSTVQASAFRLTGMTAGSGALYWTSDRVTLANYNASGTVLIEANGGAAVATFGGATYNNDFVGTGRFQGLLSGDVGILSGINNSGSARGYTTNYQNNVNSRSWRMIGEQFAYGDFAIQQSTTQTGTSYDTKLYINPSGNVGIGTTSPNAKMQVVGDTSGSMIKASYNTYDDIRTTYIDWFGIKTTAGSTNNNMEITMQGGNSSNGAILFSTGTSTATERMRISSGGNVRIGTSTVDPSENLTISKTLPNITSQNGGVLGLSNGYYSCKINSMQENFLDLLGLGFETTFAGASSIRFRIYANGNYQFFGSNVSDQRAKENINNLDFNATEKIIALQPKSYYMKNDNKKLKYGFIAQEVYEVLPDLVNGDLSDEGFVGLDYNGIIPFLVKAIQELKSEIEILKNK